MPQTEKLLAGGPFKPSFGLSGGVPVPGKFAPAARSRFLAVHSDSISTRPSQPFAHWRKLLHSQQGSNGPTPIMDGEGEKQEVPPLRCSPVGMTNCFCGNLDLSQLFDSGAQALVI
jgi:hypothetical protein